MPTPRNQRTAIRKQRTRDAILEAARVALRRDGVAGFSLSEVADSMGLTTPALYYYFTSREDLVFELLMREMTAAAQRVHDAVERTETGADALEALVRATFDHFSHDLELFRLVHQRPSSLNFDRFLTPERLAGIRPLNELQYRGTEDRIRADCAAGRAHVSSPRRLAFLAMTSAVGVLTMKALVEPQDPLIHTDEDLLHDIFHMLRSQLRTSP